MSPGAKETKILSKFALPITLMPMTQKEGRESEYQYKIHFDDVDGYVIKSEGVPEKRLFSRK